ncbi:uncharacterized protein LOC141818381 [Curcuma longa]|uniref:uncharacterized protein LOC141818381 n=1 Tax=Curcuma longa TaxID=136217 RepID=UPI003D9DE6BA
MPAESALAPTPPRHPARGKAPCSGEGSSSQQSPFAPWILDEELPRRFRAPQLSDYTGTTDPEDHLSRFENAALLHQYTDAIKCRAPSGVHLLLQRLQKRLSKALRHQSDVSEDPHGPLLHQEKSKESLKEYVCRFNQVAREVPTATSEVLVSAFSQGLIEDDFFRSLIKKPPENFDMLLTRAVKYIHVEEAQAARRINSDSQSHGGPSRQPALASRSDNHPLPQLLRRPEPEHLTVPKAGPHAIQAVNSLPTHPSGPSRWVPRFCAYHRIRSHDTRDCHQYARVLREAEEQRTRKAAPAPPPNLE